MEKIEKEKSDYFLILLLLISVALYFYKLGAPCIWNPNEAFYGEVPREMLEKKDFLTPYFNYEFRFEKPPLLYWLVAASYSIFGVSEFSVRLVPALSASFCVFLTFVLGKIVSGSNRAGLLSALTLSLAFDYNSAARYASPEIILMTLITLSLAAFYKWHSSPVKKEKWLLFFYVTAGLSTLTKGPIGIIMPCIIIGVLFLIDRDFKSMKEFISLKGISLYLLITVPWYAAMMYKHRSFFDMVYEENIIRFFTKKTGASNPLFYFTVIPWNFFPGSLFLIPAFIWMKKGLKDFTNLKFPLVWALSVFIFFSLSRTKLPPYILPMFPALSILVGGLLHNVSLKEEYGRTLKYISLFGLCIIAGGIFFVRTFFQEISMLWIAAPVALVIAGLFGFRRKLYYAALLFSGMIIFYAAFLSEVLPAIEKYRPYRDISAQVAHNDIGSNSKFYACDAFQENLCYYLKRRIESIDSDDKNNHDKLLDKIRSERGAFFLMKKNLYEMLEAGHGLRMDIVWSGKYYDKSESRFFRFLSDIKNKHIEDFVVVRSA